jgi:hypothetical protein
VKSGTGDGSDNLPGSQNSFIMDKFQDKSPAEWQPSVYRSAGCWSKPLRTALASKWEQMLATCREPRALRVEEGCAGIASAHIALKALGIKCTDGCVCDLKPHARTFVENNHKDVIENMFASMFEHASGNGHDFLHGRVIELDGKSTDVMVIGPPCQPYSAQRADRGVKKCRDHELFNASFGDGTAEDGGSAIDMIRQRLPGTFIIEQVLGFCKCDAEGFHPAATFISEVKKITKDGSVFYEAFHIFNMSPEAWLSMSRPRTAAPHTIVGL